MLRGVIFDFDGTLADTLPLCVQAFQAAFREVKGVEYTTEQIMATFGPSEEHTVAVYGGEDELECLEAYVRHYEHLHAEYALIEGTRDILDLVRDRGAKIALVTGKGPRTAEVSLRLLGLNSYFDIVEPGWQHGIRKAAAIRDVLARWQFNPDEVVYIGDAPTDVIASREAGIPVVGVAWGSLIDADGLREQRPDELFVEPTQLQNWLSERL